MDFHGYPFEVRPLSPEDGGGFLITFPDLPGCMSDGETIEEALVNGRDAFECWMWAREQDGRPLPRPGDSAASGQVLARVPKTLHTRLKARAKQEGVSMNLLVATFIAEGMGRREAKK